MYHGESWYIMNHDIWLSWWSSECLIIGEVHAFTCFILALRLSRISSLKSYREAVRLQKVQFWHWSRAPGKSSIFVLRQFFVFIFDHSFKGAYAGCCCLLAACLLLACCLCLLACCLCLLLLARCCCLPAAACLLLFACCCLPAAAGLLRCASRSWTALKKFVLSCQRLRVGVQPARNIHIPSLCWCLQPVPPASAKQGDRDWLLFSFLVKCLHQIWLREIRGPYIFYHSPANRICYNYITHLHCKKFEAVPIGVWFGHAKPDTNKIYPCK